MSSLYLPRQLGWRQRIAAAVLCALAGALVVTLTAPAAADAAKRHKRGVEIKVMTRNLFLGSSLSAGLEANNLDPELCDGAGQILREVDETQPPARMRLVAQEILNKKPDLVGLQEAVAYYTATPPDGGPLEGGQDATDVHYDFLQLILDRLNKGKRRYKVASVQNEFEFETKANYQSGLSGCANADVDARMLMRDAILARVGAGVKVSKPASENFRHQLSLELAGGIPYPVKRGWESVNATIRGSAKFRFVNTHLEAFDSAATGNNMADTATGPPPTLTPVDRGTIRATQADEVVTGPAKSKLPVILVGDLNSNVPGVQTGDFQAFQRVLDAGFKRKSTQKPPSCCVNELFTPSLADFDHVVDHIVSNRKSVKRLSSSVVGRALIGGIRGSDHAGVFSVLRIPR